MIQNALKLPKDHPLFNRVADSSYRVKRLFELLFCNDCDPMMLEGDHYGHRSSSQFRSVDTTISNCGTDLTIT